MRNCKINSFFKKNELVEEMDLKIRQAIGDYLGILGRKGVTVKPARGVNPEFVDVIKCFQRR